MISLLKKLQAQIIRRRSGTSNLKIKVNNTHHFYYVISGAMIMLTGIIMFSVGVRV